MKHPMKLLLLAGVASLAACGDASSPTANSSSSSASGSAMGGVSTDLTSTDTVVFSIGLDPRHTTTFQLGRGNYLTFPANSVCDPATSTYGVTEWDKPCTPARNAVVVQVKAWLDKAGHPRVDFMPHLRFAPSAVPSNWVTLTFSDFAASLDPWFNILFCSSLSSTCYDESKTDASLVTVRDPVTGRVTRRIKHFSGYLVGAGEDDGGTFNRSGSSMLFTTPIDNQSMSKRKSGYILVSGRR